MNRRRSKLTDRDVENKVIETTILIAIIFFCTSLMLSTLADVACSPAARPALSPTSSIPPISLPSTTAAMRSEQAGELASFYREVFCWSFTTIMRSTRIVVSGLFVDLALIKAALIARWSPVNGAWPC